MDRTALLKKLLVYCFVGTLFVGAVKNDSVNTFLKLLQSAKHDSEVSASVVDSEYSSAFSGKNTFVDLNGFIARLIGMQGYYMDMGMYVDDNRQVVTTSPETSTDYEYDQLADFNSFLRENNINLLYVNEPTKYVDDNYFEDQFGVKTYSNQNIDKLLNRLDEASIPYVDLRESIAEEGIEVSSLFYRTDHHWTTKAGLWAVKNIATGMNQMCGYNIDESLFDIDKYDVKEWKKCWLGEYGRKVSVKYVGLDDYWEIKPKFSTDYSFKNADGTTTDGTFDTFINEDIYNTDTDVYESASWHYSYSQLNCINNNVSDGKVLMLTDSYDCVTEPFLSLGVHEVDAIILRDQSEENFDLRDYILQNDYDTVLICYAQFMVGAHDDETSANYRMFNFH